ncbi:MAG: EAL domain-containing protein [gamma proteobacterium symbiont of Taylorina sp.]|nr:EAL domain-containing protein [gamma proteobacterium symbiont of Taylorina sp.]
MKQPKILIVDDISANIIALKALLSSLPVQTIAATSGNEALALTLEHDFALILLDVQMPEMNGYEVAEFLREEEETQQVPIIFVTAVYKDEQHLLQGYGAGAVDYIEKPINEEILLSKVKIFLELHQQKEQLAELLKKEKEHNLLLKKEVTERIEAEQRLRNLSQVVEQSPTAAIITNANSEIQYVNAQFEALTGYTLDEVRGKKTSLLKSDDTPDEIYKDMWETILSGKTWRGEINNRSKNGDTFWVYATVSAIHNARDEITHFVSVQENITLRKQYEERLLKQSNFDDITELPNRLLAIDRLNQALASTKRSKLNLALMYIDLDDFKKINDSMGHDTGNKILVECASRLTQLMRSDDTVARLGGDEFLILMVGLEDREGAERAAEKILNALSNPYEVNEEDQSEQMFLSASIGITYAPDNGFETQSLIQNSEAAMYHAKKAGGNTYRFFSSAMNEAVKKRLTIENHLRHALKNQELYLVYQPQIDLKKKRILGAEALLRWNNPELGMISPVDFIPLAESTGLILEIGEWVLDQALAQVHYWNRRHKQPLRIAVNCSSKQFNDKNLAKKIQQMLKHHAVDPCQLELEITESLLMNDTPATMSMLEELRSVGVTISIDDFGTGYSSLSYLTRFPINIVKIDQSFVQHVHHDLHEAVVCRGIIGLSHGLKIKVIAEGVETDEQLKFMIENDCDIIQGYYFSRPLLKKDFEKFMRAELAL